MTAVVIDRGEHGTAHARSGATRRRRGAVPAPLPALTVGDAVAAALFHVCGELCGSDDRSHAVLAAVPADSPTAAHVALDGALRAVGIVCWALDANPPRRLVGGRVPAPGVHHVLARWVTA